MSNLVADAVAGLGRSEGPTDERPLTDQERQTVARLLSDPFAFPQTFKTWLVAFLESSDLTLPISSIQGLGSTLGIGGGGNTSFIQGLLPAGTILGWGSARLPSGCLRCDGSAYSRTAYSRLFTEIGTQWGAGDGVTTFNVPDLRRRMVMGAGSTGYGLGTNEGRAEGNRSPDHHHYFSGYGGYSGRTGGAGSHAHTYRRHTEAGISIQQGTQGSFATVGGTGGFDASTDNQGQHDHDYSGGVSISGDTSGGFDQDRPSFMAIYFIITT